MQTAIIEIGGTHVPKPIEDNKCFIVCLSHVMILLWWYVGLSQQVKQEIGSHANEKATLYNTTIGKMMQATFHKVLSHFDRPPQIRQCKFMIRPREMTVKSISLSNTSFTKSWSKMKNNGVQDGKWIQFEGKMYKLLRKRKIVTLVNLSHTLARDLDIVTNWLPLFSLHLGKTTSGEGGEELTRFLFTGKHSP